MLNPDFSTRTLQKPEGKQHWDEVLEFCMSEDKPTAETYFEA